MAIRILLSACLGERRWNQSDLIRATGIRRATVSELYNELVDKVNLEDLDLICEALECDISDLLYREENTTPCVKFTASDFGVKVTRKKTGKKPT